MHIVSWIRWEIIVGLYSTTPKHISRPDPRTHFSTVSNILSNYKTGSPVVKSTKEKIEELDEAKKKVAYSVIGGDIMQYYKTFKATLEVIPEGEGSQVKWLCEFEKASEEVPDPNMIRDLAAKNFKDIDAYLLKA